MIFPEVKSNIQWKQQEIKDLVAANFYKKYLQNFKYNVKKVCIFQLILGSIPSILTLSAKNRGGCGAGGGRGKGGCLTEKSVKRDKSYLSTVPNMMNQ